MTEQELSELRQKVAAADELRRKIRECDRSLENLSGATCLHFDIKTGFAYSPNTEDGAPWIRASSNFPVFMGKSIDPDFTTRVVGFIRAEITRQKAEFQKSLDNL